MRVFRTSQWRFVAGLVVLGAILALSVFLFSPWHRHDHLSTAPCVFSTLEHSPCEGASGPIILIQLPAQWCWLYTRVQPALSDLTANCEALVRAPPASFSTL